MQRAEVGYDGAAAGRPLLHRLRGPLAAAAGRLPQCRYENLVVVEGHMRAGTTALVNVLASRPDISGYGEAHVAWSGPDPLGLLVLRQIRARRWRPAARYLVDKVLHDRLDRDLPQAHFDSRAVFLVRHPAAAIGSIRRLVAVLGDRRWPNDEAAADYYERRLCRLLSLWPRFAPERRLALTHARLTGNSEAALARVSTLLGLERPLVNTYRPDIAPRRRDVGDPLVAPVLDQIVGRRLSALPAPQLSPGRLDALVALYREMARLADR